MIHLTYSARAASGSTNGFESERSYLNNLENQREELQKAILQAPRHRLDHLATFVETHGERLSHFLEALISYRRAFRMFRIKQGLIGLSVGVLCGGAATLAIVTSAIFSMDQRVLLAAGGGVALAVLFLWMTLPLKFFASRFHRNHLSDFDKLTPLESQTRRDSWQVIRHLAYTYLKKTAGRFSLRRIKQEYAAVCRVRDKGSREIREALNELAAMSDDEPAASNDSRSA